VPRAQCRLTASVDSDTEECHAISKAVRLPKPRENNAADYIALLHLLRAMGRTRQGKLRSEAPRPQWSHRRVHCSAVRLRRERPVQQQRRSGVSR
jgi:hypothetical protein